MPSYRPNVACILRNTAGEILICERKDWPGCWQFPQGGVKKGESLEQALYREVEEELCLKKENYEIVTSKGPYRYLFANGRKKEGYEGQEQHYFLATLTNSSAQIRFDGESDEFRASRWIPPASYDLNWVASVKREVYTAVFQDFFEVSPRIARA